MKKYCAKILTMIVVLVLFLPMEVSAENGEGLKVDGSGQITLVSSYASEEDISSMSFSLYVKAAASDKVEFRFNESNGKIREFRYDKESGKLRVYIAGTEALMKDGAQSLNIGSVQVLNGNGGAAAATVSVAAGSLMYVDGDALKWMGELEPQETVQINSSGTPPTPPPTAPPTTAPPTQTPTAPPTQTPTAPPTQAPAPPPQEPDNNSPQQPAATPTPQPTASPTPQPTRAPQAVQTPWPVRPSQPGTTASPSPSPEPTQTPEPSGASQESDSSESMVPVVGEPGDGHEAGESGGIDWVFVIAIGAMALFVIVAVMAVVVLKKKPGFDGGNNDF